jgi:hypothetical protein
MEPRSRTIVQEEGSKVGIIKPSDDVVFANEKVKSAWLEVEKTDPDLAKQLLKAKENIKENAFCGIQVPKKKIPNEWIKKYKINNLWKYNLPNAWRLLYSVTTPTKIEIISVFLDWMNHKDYDRLFGY